MKKKIVCFVLLLVVLLISFLLIYNFNKKSEIKYVFLFIGDGMSSSQVELTEIYKESVMDDKEVLSFSNFPVVGLRKNKSASSYVTDSAASATVLASGVLTYNGSINIGVDGEKLSPITYWLSDKGYEIGIITNVSINHATPASFYGYASSRDDYDTLAYDLADSNFKFFAGDNFILSNISNDVINSYLLDKGYDVIDSYGEFDNLNSCSKCVILNPYSNFSLDNKNNFDLSSYVEKGIEVLDNENGFFMMIESAKIDGALHSNDAKSAIYEVIELDKAVRVALDFASKHRNETLIIVTGDHETGGLSLGNNTLSYALDLRFLEKQKYSYQQLLNYSYSINNNNVSYDEVLKYLNSNYGVDETFDFDKIYNAYLSVLSGNYDALYKEVLLQINNKAGIYFSTNNHTGSRIPVYAYGVFSEDFSGVYDSVEFNKRLRSVFR